MKQPVSSEVEVVLITYKYDHWLPGCLDALAKQSLQPARVRVSDDASPGQHGEAFRALAAHYPWAEFHQNPHNMGNIAHVRQRIHEVSAPYYLLLSADDLLIDPDFLRDAVEALRQTPTAVAVYGQYHVMDQTGRVVHAAPKVAVEPTSVFSAAEMRSMLALSNVVPAVCTVVRTSVHQQVPPFPIDNALAHDWCQWYLMAEQGDFVRINRPVLQYRVHQQSLSQSMIRDQRALQETKLMYDQLLAWPGVSDQERAMLRRGKARNAMKMSRFRDLPAFVASTPWRDLYWQDIQENGLLRLENILRRWHTASRAHLRGH
jgi:hypothetical protein